MQELHSPFRPTGTLLQEVGAYSRPTTGQNASYAQGVPLRLWNSAMFGEGVMRSLKELDVRDTKMLPEAVLRLRRALPRCEVKF